MTRKDGAPSRSGPNIAEGERGGIARKVRLHKAEDEALTALMARDSKDRSRTVGDLALAAIGAAKTTKRAK